MDIEPQSEDSVGTARLREGSGAHNFPEIEVASNESEKKSLCVLCKCIFVLVGHNGYETQGTECNLS